MWRDIIREPVELIDQDLDEVAGTFIINIGELNVGVDQLKVASPAALHVNVGIGKPPYTFSAGVDQN